MESALKSCVLRCTSPSPSPSASYDHLLVTDDHFLGGGGNDDLFPVEDLLVDFSNDGPLGDDYHGEGSGSGSGSFQEKDDFGSVSSNDDDDRNSCFFSFSSQLAVPDDDLAELEWVSHFVHDSVPEFPPFCGITLPGSEQVSVGPPCFPTHVPVRARSKRPRVARREHPSSSSSDSSGNSSCLSFAGPGGSSGSGGVEQGRKRKRADRPVAGGGVPQSQRRCTHCQAQRTPQWRAGPHGAKTLCNACGVRYKSGRLLPEYRPACSPTFSVEKHSNSHRKVMEMRRRKEESV
ncbi:hypothetical protein MLD38_032320 [Melastoma candidum]|uniref:Uncharacterized protein n=1 Tax=Melastoma candidum TaxID=119954 RepID=A0ACB9M374_9MYRT|nr:hypothetical protein MLD38_032320 [Melastoma candidum]